MSLPSLVQGSRRIVVVTALASESHFEELGRRRRIVTDTRVRVEERLAKADGADSELLIRTLGGSLGRLGERVHGQAQLVVGEPCVAFLLQGPDGLHYVNGMAQGHYPLQRDSAGTELLRRSPAATELLDEADSAVRRLMGLRVSEARSLVQQAVRR